VAGAIIANWKIEIALMTVSAERRPLRNHGASATV
jgi:hypothetical protein